MLKKTTILIAFQQTFVPSCLYIRLLCLQSACTHFDWNSVVRDSLTGSLNRIKSYNANFNLIFRLLFSNCCWPEKWSTQFLWAYFQYGFEWLLFAIIINSKWKTKLDKWWLCHMVQNTILDNWTSEWYGFSIWFYVCQQWHNWTDC